MIRSSLVKSACVAIALLGLSAPQAGAIELQGSNPSAQLSEGIGTQQCGILPVDSVAPGTGTIEATQDIHQRRLARPGRPHNGDKLAGVDRQIDIPQNGDAASRRAELPPQTRQFK